MESFCLKHRLGVVVEKNREKIVDPEEMLQMIKETYQNFNAVLKECSESEKFAAIVKINLLNQTFKNYMTAIDETHQIPTKMLMEEFDKNAEVPVIKDLYGKIAEVEKVMGETKKLMDKHSPVMGRAKVKKGRSGMRRLGRNRIKD